jgi:RND family efflux transporter MFP subunit
VRSFKIVSPLCLVLGGIFAADAGAAEFDCAIQPRQMLEVRSPVEGLIDRITVNRGDLVRKGQELAFIDTSVERVLAESAKYRSEMSGATRAGQSKVQLSARKLDRAEELFSKAFVAEQVRDDALNEKQLADAELQEARDNRKLAEIEHQRQLTLIRMKTIRSPINGVVMERVQNVGELAEAGVGRKAILKLAEIETLYVEALLPAEAYRQVRVGMVGQVSPAAPEGSVERATVTVIDRVLDAGSGTFGVRLELPNSDARLLAGVRCKLTLAGVKVTTLTGTSDSQREQARPRPAKISTTK